MNKNRREWNQMIAKKLQKKIVFSTLIFAFFLFSLLNSGCARGTTPEEEWNMTFGGIGNDLIGDGQQTLDGGYILAGTTSYGLYSDCRLIKTNSDGYEQWNKTFEEIICDTKSVQQTSDGGYIFTGSTSYILEETDLYTTISSDFLLIKTDSKGYQQWKKTFGGNEDEWAFSIQQTSDGGYILGGITKKTGSWDYWLVKTNLNGNKLWDKAFGGTDDEWLYSVQQTTDNGYILAGANPNDCWLIKTDSDGNRQWDKVFGGNGDDYAYSVQQTIDGGYIFAGGTESHGAGYMDFWLVKIDSNGNEQWNKTFGGFCLDMGQSVKQTSDSGYIVAGMTKCYGVGGFDVWLVKTDSNGNKQWDKTFGGIRDDGAQSIQQTSDDGYIIFGETNSYGAGEKDFWLIKVEEEPVEFKIKPTELKEIPTPPQVSEINITNETILKGIIAVYLEMLNDTLEKNPRNEIAWYYRGFLLSSLDRNEEAITAYDEAIGINPKYAEAWAGKGFALQYLDRHEEAITACDKAIEINPKYADAWAGKGSALQFLGRHEEAITAYDEAIKINPNYADAWTCKGSALQYLGRYDEALEAHEKAIEINPKLATAWYNKGAALSHLGRKEESIEAAKIAHELDPTLEIPKTYGFKSTLALLIVFAVVYYLGRRK